MIQTPLLLALSAACLSWAAPSPVAVPVSPAAPPPASSGTSIGTNFCQANPNSTGVPGLIEAFGSLTLADNDITLVASDLPLQSFGFFITSQKRGFVPNPTGQTLCIRGQIGRYVAPGQVKNSGTSGQISLAIDLMSMPQPAGPIAAMIGDEWNFQAWYRDVFPGPFVTSDFTNGVTVVLE